MDLELLLRFLILRRRLRQRERWSRSRLAAYQAEAVSALRTHAVARSPFYRRFHAGLERRPLSELPVLTKAELMANFDDVVTDPDVQLADVEAYLGRVGGDERFRSRYRVVATSGSTGLRGIFLSDAAEWSHVIASYARAQEWAGIVPSLRHRVRLAVVSTTTPWHQSARVGASVSSPLAPTLRLSATDRPADIVRRLIGFQPTSLVAYASMLRLLSEEQLDGRLSIAPRAVFSASEVLTADTRRLITEAWGTPPFDVYAATEPAGIASECDRHAGMHLYEDLVISEVLDENDRPVPPGIAGAKLVVTVLFSRTQPLIRYEMSDLVVASDRSCPCGRTFRLIEGVQGRAEDMLYLAGRDGRRVAIHPNVFHDVLDRLPAGEWQIVQEESGVMLLVASPGSAFDGDAVAASIRMAVEAAGAIAPSVSWGVVDAIPRSGTGKAPLIRARRP